MNLSSLLVIVLVILLFSVAITFAIFTSIRPSQLEAIPPKKGSMGKPTPIGGAGQARDAFLASSGGTLLVFVNCYVNSKTPTIGQVEEPIRILQVGNALQLQIVPGGASKPPSTRLAIQTQGPNSPEFIHLKDFPQQKWVHLAIVREGRRYTVYYNGKTAGSSRTKYFPTINSSQLTMGDTKLAGEFMYPKLAPSPFRQMEIEQELQAMSDTRNEPYKETDFSSLLKFSFGCPSGLFCFTTQRPPTNNPLKFWKSPYA